MTEEEDVIERFRKRFVKGKRADPDTYEFRVFRNIEQFIQSEKTKAKEEEKKRILETLFDLEVSMGDVCSNTEGASGCDEANSFQFARNELEKALK